MTDPVPVAEVFTSFQGEGPLVGVRQVFVRLRGCDLTCRYCDTAAARELEGPCRVELAPGSGEFREVPGRMRVGELAALVRGVVGAAGAVHSVALTGGEPLLYPEAARGLAEGLGEARVFLETAGHRPEALAEVVDAVAYVSLDFKLASTLAEPVPPEWFVESYRVAGERCVAVKMVVTAETEPGEVGEACRLLAAVNRRGPVVLQPVTALGEGVGPPGGEDLARLYEAAAAHMDDVRVIPQCHRLVGVL
jgi:organic radical activating enzyme